MIRIEFVRDADGHELRVPEMVEVSTLQEALDLARSRFSDVVFTKCDASTVYVLDWTEAWTGNDVCFAKIHVPPRYSLPPAVGNLAVIENDSDSVTIKSPMIGTFYGQPSPDDPPFVSLRDHVSPLTMIGYIEAMKLFTQIHAEVEGIVTDVLVRSGDVVEYAQPLFVLKRIN